MFISFNVYGLKLYEIKGSDTAEVNLYTIQDSFRIDILDSTFVYPCNGYVETHRGFYNKSFNCNKNGLWFFRTRYYFLKGVFKDDVQVGKWQKWYKHAIDSADTEYLYNSSGDLIEKSEYYKRNDTCILVQNKLYVNNELSSTIGLNDFMLWMLRNWVDINFFVLILFGIRSIFTALYVNSYVQSGYYGLTFSIFYFWFVNNPEFNNSRERYFVNFLNVFFVFSFLTIDRSEIIGTKFSTPISVVF